MKKNCIKSAMMLCILFGCLQNLFAQVDTLSQVTPQKKGNLTLVDGGQVAYKNLTVSNDTVTFTGVSGLQERIAGNDIYKITKIKRQTATYAISMGLGGLLGGFLGTISWNGTSLEDDKAAFIIGATVGCAGLGAIIGALIKKEKLVYKNPTIDFSLNQIKIAPTNEKYFALGIQIKLRNNQ